MLYIQLSYTEQRSANFLERFRLQATIHLSYSQVMRVINADNFNTRDKTMSGFITQREVEANEAFITETWGEDFFALCMKSEGTTFLALLVEHNRI